MKGLLLSVLFVFSAPSFADEVRLDSPEESQATSQNSGSYEDLLNAGAITEQEYELLVNNALVLERMKAYESPGVKRTVESTESKLKRWEVLYENGNLSESEYRVLINSQRVLDSK